MNLNYKYYDWDMRDLYDLKRKNDTVICENIIYNVRYKLFHKF